MVSACTRCLTLTNSTFCVEFVSVMCFVWISEQTAIISLYNINWLVVITEKECVYCAVRTGYLNVVRLILRLYPWHCQMCDVLHGYTSLLLTHRAQGYRRFGEPAPFIFSTERSQFQGSSQPNCTASHRTRLCLLHMYAARHCTWCSQ